MTTKEAVFRNMEKHCRMIRGLREIPRGILFPAQKNKWEEPWFSVSGSKSFWSRRSCIYKREPRLLDDYKDWEFKWTLLLLPVFWEKDILVEHRWHVWTRSSLCQEGSMPESAAYWSVSRTARELAMNIDLLLGFRRASYEEGCLNRSKTPERIEAAWNTHLILELF